MRFSVFVGLGLAAVADAFSMSGSSFMGAPTLVAPAPVRTSSTATITMISHGKKVAKLGRPADQRKALLRALTTETIRHGRVKTTLTRARAVRPFVDKMISLAKDGSLHSRRQVSFLGDTPGGIISPNYAPRIYFRE